MATEANEVVAPFQVRPPTPKPCVVPKIDIGRKSRSEFGVVPQENPRMRHHRTVVLDALRTNRRGPRRDETAWIWPIRR